MRKERREKVASDVERLNYVNLGPRSSMVETKVEKCQRKEMPGLEQLRADIANAMGTAGPSALRTVCEAL